MPLDYLYGILHGADAIQGYPDYIARFQGTVCYASARIDNYQVRGRVVGLSPFDDLGLRFGSVILGTCPMTLTLKWTSSMISPGIL